MPQRYQRSRRRGARLPPGTVVVSRPSRWGNPHPLELGRPEAVRRYRDDLLAGRLGVDVDDVRRQLRGRDLACWCPLDGPCHADVLLEIANDRARAAPSGRGRAGPGTRRSVPQMAEGTTSGLGISVDEHIATITIDSPPINLFTVPLFLEMAATVDRLAADDDVRVVVLRSADPEFFIAHFDVAAILGFPTDTPPPTELGLYHRMCEQLRTMPKATIAVIEGRVGGGGSELALGCDMRFAALPADGRPGATFNQPEVALGIIPGGTGTVRLPRLIGRSRALEVILGCDDVDAATAERWGWVNRALPPDELWPFVDRLSRRIASFPPHAVAAAKASIVRAERGVEEDLLLESAAFNATLADPATTAAMRAFLERGGQTRDGELRLGELAGELG